MINLREIILGALMDIVEEEQYSHIVLKDVLEKYQYLDKRDRAFITRVTEGTLENMLQMDYIIERFSKVKVENMKPVIRNILRMSVYQLKYMDSVPDSAVCNEGVRLAQKRGFYQLFEVLQEIWTKWNILQKKNSRCFIFQSPIPCRNGL